MKETFRILIAGVLGALAAYFNMLLVPLAVLAAVMLMDYVTGMLRGGMSSPSELFMAQMQDWLFLGGESRMNSPGRLGGNWQWRMKSGAITPRLTKKIARMTEIYGRKQ